MEIEIKGIRKHFRKKVPLRDVSLGATDGTCIGILGRNGSGKSTLLSILAGVQRCDAGSFCLDGRDLFADRRALADSVGYVPQGTLLLEELTAWDNLRFWYDRDRLRDELQGGVLAMLGIPEFLRVPVSRMSGGMKKRLSIGCAVAGGPRILLLDEPTAALDLIAKERIAEYLRHFKAQGGILLLTTHDEQELSLCDTLFILKDGVLVPFTYDGDVHRLAAML